jgi:phosphate transport system substrate-binding protein
MVIAYFIKNKLGKGILSAVSFLGFSFLAFLFAIFFLSSMIGPDGFWLSFVLCGTLYIELIILVWKPFSVKTRRIVEFTIPGVIIILTAIFIVPSVYKSSLPESREEIYLPDYAPFGNYWYEDGVLTYHETLVAKLGEESALKLYGELPRLDGATALYPLYSAFTRATYPEPEPEIGTPEYYPYGDYRERDSDYAKSLLVVCSRTAVAFENLIDGYADVIFLMGISDEQRALATERGLELVLTPIGREAFVFFVNNRNSASNLSAGNIRRIYSGEVTNWKEVGGSNDVIRAYQRPDESGSQTMLKQIMGDAPLVPAPQDEILSTMMGMYEKVAEYRNYRNALGYSFLYYIRDMIGENKVKFLSVDGIAPLPENIRSGEYPFSIDFYAITVRRDGEYLNPQRTDNIDKLLGWVLSSQGQYLVDATGYITGS